jgi:hypothetical protein
MSDSLPVSNYLPRDIENILTRTREDEQQAKRKLYIGGAVAIIVGLGISAAAVYILQSTITAWVKHQPVETWRAVGTFVVTPLAALVLIGTCGPLLKAKLMDKQKEKLQELIAPGNNLDKNCKAWLIVRYQHAFELDVVLNHFKDIVQRNVELTEDQKKNLNIDAFIQRLNKEASKDDHWARQRTELYRMILISNLEGKEAILKALMPQASELD